jgi:DNA-binding IclR family transcriptional regulator
MVTEKAGKQASIYRVQVLERAFRILDVIAENGGGTSISDISGRLQLHKATAHRLLMFLESERFIERKGSSGNYHIGSRILELGLSALSRLDLCDIARPQLHLLVEQTGETSHLAVLREGDVVCLAYVESTQTVRTPSAVGTRVPAHCTALGKAMLAFLPKQLDDFLRVGKLQPFTRKTITSASRLRAELRLIGQRGYAVDNEEREAGLRCIGAPVRDSSGAVIGAVSISGPAFRVRPERVPTLATSVMTAASRISVSLGYRPAKRA